MRDPLLDALERQGEGRCLVWTHRPSGLRALLVLDTVRGGLAAGGVRTRAYPSLAAAAEDGARLAHAMTLKCALAGLPAGGGKAVVLEHPGMQRRAAFEQLGRFVEELGGLFRTAGDLGTGPDDLAAMARTTRFVHADGDALAAGAARGVVRCIEACAELLGQALSTLTVAVQGCGAIGGATARHLAEAGARLLLADIDPARAAEAARETGGRVVSPDAILSIDADILAPCALGGVLSADTVGAMRARAVCGGANNLLADERAAELLVERGILVVPDVISSAGAVVEGLGRTLLGADDRAPLIAALGPLATRVLLESRETGVPPHRVAERLAAERLANGGSGG